MNSLVETTKKFNLEIPKKPQKKQITCNYYFHGTFLTFWRERNRRANCHLDNYIENNLPIRTPSYPSDVRGISDSRFQITSREDWKEEIEALNGFLSRGRLIFSNEEIRKVFIKECDGFSK